MLAPPSPNNIPVAIGSHLYVPPPSLSPFFPSSHLSQLDKLIPIVQETCKEFNVDYKNYSSFREILASVHAVRPALPPSFPSFPSSPQYHCL